MSEQNEKNEPRMETQQLRGPTKQTPISAREALLRDVNDQEQRCLDRLVLLRKYRDLVQLSLLSEVEAMLEIVSIQNQLSYPR